MPDVTVLYVNWNTADELAASLQALTPTHATADLEIIVVDNASTDRTVEMLRNGDPTVRLIANSENRGFATAGNQGWQTSTAPLVRIMNPDTLLQPETLAAMVAFMRASPGLAACAPALDDEEGRSTENARPFPPLTLRLDHDIRARPHGEPLDIPDGPWGSVTRAHWLMGACLLVRRQALEDTGGFDEGFFLYGEDIDWCYRARRAGWEIALLDDLTATHSGNRSASQVPGRTSTWRRHDGYFRYLARAHGPLAARANFLWWLLRSALASAVLCPLALARPSLRSRRDHELGRLGFCVSHLGAPFVLCRFGSNHAPRSLEPPSSASRRTAK